MNVKNLLLALVAVLALALFVAMGGDGPDNEVHAEWMAATRDSGAAVLW